MFLNPVLMQVEMAVKFGIKEESRDNVVPVFQFAQQNEAYVCVGWEWYE